jgi:hypothetical protein
MSAFWGADPVQLRTLAGSLREESIRLNELSAKLRRALETNTWKGPDGEGFRSAWTAQHQPALDRCSTILMEGARTVEVNAKEQEQASNGIGAGLSVRAVGDRDGEPSGYGEHRRFSTPVSEAEEDLRADMIRQGQIGDCWLLAGLGAVVHTDSGLIRENLERNEDGSYTVTFYRDGTPVEITVEASRIKEAARDPQGQPNFATIYEKAAAEFFGGDYEDIVADDPQRALEAITGKDARTDGELSFTEIHERLEQGPVVAITESGGDWNPFTSNDGDVDNEQIVANHAYIVTEIKDGKVHLINPWGPDGGPGSDGHNKVGDIWLTEEEYRENFSHISSLS